MVGRLGRTAFLSKFGGPIARVAVVGARKWEELAGDVIGATVLMQADIRYFHPSEIAHAWHWVKTAKYAGDLPVRTNAAARACYERRFAGIHGFVSGGASSPVSRM